MLRLPCLFHPSYSEPGGPSRQVLQNFSHKLGKSTEVSANPVWLQTPCQWDWKSHLLRLCKTVNLGFFFSERHDWKRYSTFTHKWLGQVLETSLQQNNSLLWVFQCWSSSPWRMLENQDVLLNDLCYHYSFLETSLAIGKPKQFWCSWSLFWLPWRIQQPNIFPLKSPWECWNTYSMCVIVCSFLTISCNFGVILVNCRKLFALGRALSPCGRMGAAEMHH